MHRNGSDPRGAPFDGSIERVGDNLAVIAPRGELDAYSYEAFRQELLDVESATVVVDLTEVTFVDSVTLGAIVQASKRARARGDALTVVCSDPHIRKVIEVTGLAELLHLERSLSDAVMQALGS